MVAETLPDLVPSIRVMEKLGMVREAVIPRARFDNGVPVDRYRYSILRREWEALRQDGCQPITGHELGSIAAS